jgi:prephenate dehydratase
VVQPLTAGPRAAEAGAAPEAAAGTADGSTLKAAAGAARVAYAGERGAFAEDAVLAYFGDVPRVALPGFRDVFEAVTAGAAADEGAAGAAGAGAASRSGPAAVPVRFGVVPIENLVNGTVRENYDLLLEHDLRIAGEAVVPVRLCLAALPGESLESIERVYSHIQALGQAEGFLRTRRWTLLTTYNTAGAGKLIAERAERHAAAILSPRAAALFGLEILAGGIQSVPDNRTRFLVLARPGVEEPAGGSEVAPAAATGAPDGASPDGPARRTTLVFTVRNEPGALLRVLRVFADRGLNLTSLESRPTRQRAWEYDFWADLDADLAAAGPSATEALDALRAETTMLRVLGSYPQAAEA